MAKLKNDTPAKKNYWGRVPDPFFSDLTNLNHFGQADTQPASMLASHTASHGAGQAVNQPALRPKIRFWDRCHFSTTFVFNVHLNQSDLRILTKNAKMEGDTQKEKTISRLDYSQVGPK